MTAIPALGRIIARFLSTRGEHCAVRTVLRHRSELVMTASQHVQHMHKALTQMNLQIHHVISDITGTTGLAIVAGQRDAAELAKLRDPHIKAHAETIRKSLVGNWRSEHLFTLKPKHAVCVRKPTNSLRWTCGW
jgi:transposase